MNTVGSHNATILCLQVQIFGFLHFRQFNFLSRIGDCYLVFCECWTLVRSSWHFSQSLMIEVHWVCQADYSYMYSVHSITWLPAPGALAVHMVKWIIHYRPVPLACPRKVKAAPIWFVVSFHFLYALLAPVVHWMLVGYVQITLGFK